MILYVHELKMNLKSWILWTLCVGGMCLGCILLYTTMEDSLKDMADMYANLGSMSTAMGMDKISIATMNGFFATEIAMMHGLGGAMFSALIGIGILSKEEMLHTSEFLHTFPYKRIQIVWQKYLAFVTNVVLFNMVCMLLYILGYAVLGEEIMWKEMLLFLVFQILMQLEIGTICFMISAFNRKNQIGAGLGLAILFFAADMMCRIIPALENVNYITPFYYANGADLFSGQEIDATKTVIAVAVTVITALIAWKKYTTKDLAS